MKIAYILNSFPNISNTFIINEIVAMQKRGLDIRVYAFFNPRTKVVHEKVYQIRDVRYFKGRRFGRMVLCHFFWFFSKPFRYARALLLSLWPSNGLFKTFLVSMGHVYEVYRYRPEILHAHFGKRTADFCVLVKLLTGIHFTIN